MPPDSLGPAFKPSYPMHTAGCCLGSDRLNAYQLHCADKYHAVPKPTTPIDQVVSTVVTKIFPWAPSSSAYQPYHTLRQVGFGDQ